MGYKTARCFSLVLILGLILGLCALSPLLEGREERIQIRADFTEADAVLAILAKRDASQPITDGDWQALFDTEPYQRLKKREAAFHAPFSDEEFKAFALSDELLTEREALARTVMAWKKANLRAPAARVLKYLPAESVIRAKVFPVIKPRHNSFVFDADTDPAIFLCVNSGVSAASFENTVAHEMHHIGLSSVDKQYEQKIAALAPAAKSVAMWMGAFGEGEAMLAAAGELTADPVATASPELKENWARGARDFNDDLANVNDFFLQVLDGKLQGDAIEEKGSSFFGSQGPWYTVGYQMAVIVEARYGRAALIECMRDMRLLLVRYNQAAQELNQPPKAKGAVQAAEHYAVWSAEILEATQAPGR
jgi:Putative zinc dependent peptidase (DUF5700)